MKTPNANKWIAVAIVVTSLIGIILYTEDKVSTLPKRETNQTIYVLPRVSDMPTTTNPLSF
jgi:hypothetical protein